MSISPLHIEIDKVDRNSWDYLITQFDDASIYQTWSWGSSGGRALSHIVMKAKHEILGCCQVSLRRLPFLKIGIADVNWGPLCMRGNGTFDSDVLLCLLHEIKLEYAKRRGYLLRIWPHAIGERKELVKQILDNEGFKRVLSERPYRTLVLDLSPSIQNIRQSFLQKWRNCLNKSERNDLKVIQGTGDDLFNIAVTLAQEMGERKNLATIVDYFEGYRRIQANLPESLKMNIMICKLDGEPLCATICSAIGDTGIYLLGATAQKGLKFNASYLLQWRMIQWMKEKGVHYYDLGAFNPELNPSVYHFKLGIAGKKGWEETFLGRYHGSFNSTSRFTDLILHYSKKLRGLYRR